MFSEMEKGLTTPSSEWTDVERMRIGIAIANQLKDLVKKDRGATPFTILDHLDRIVVVLGLNVEMVEGNRRHILEGIEFASSEEQSPIV